MLQRDLIRVGGKFVGVGNDMIWEGSREEDDLNSLWQKTANVLVARKLSYEHFLLFDPNALIPKPLLFQHVICLVEDKDLNFRRVQETPPNHIHRSSWSTDNNLSSEDLAPAGFIHWYTCTNIDILHELAHYLENPNNLTSEFTSWS